MVRLTLSLEWSVPDLDYEQKPGKIVERPTFLCACATFTKSAT